MTYIQTITGRTIDFTDPDPEQIHILDIATGLARAPRFAGHTDVAWTVAAHSLFVSDHCPPELQFEGLLHDAAEAYMGDVPTPLKRLCHSYTVYEGILERAIRKRYGLGPWASTHVEDVDRWALEEERRAFCKNSTWSMPPAIQLENTWADFERGMGFGESRYVFLIKFLALCPDQFKEEAEWALENR